MNTVACLYGTRPEAIKLAPLVHQLRQCPGIDPMVVSTGQHRDLLRAVEQIFELHPDHDLQLASDGSVGRLTARVIHSLVELWGRTRPDVVVVQGDTSSAMAGALTAYSLSIPVVHLEAGLRSGNLASPFPEEGNRRVISQLAALHLAPTFSAAANLLGEGADPATVLITGNTVIDALLSVTSSAHRPQSPVLDLAQSLPGGYLLVTAHRRENWGDPLARITRALRCLSESNPDLMVVVALHPNPTVSGVFRASLADRPNVMLLDPVEYDLFSWLLAGARLALTDSGGVQEEAPALGVPVLVLRDTTERPEGVLVGAAELVGTDEREIIERTQCLLDDPALHAAMATAVSPYGDGTAAARSARAISALALGQPIDQAWAWRSRAEADPVTMVPGLGARVV